MAPISRNAHLRQDPVTSPGHHHPQDTPLTREPSTAPMAQPPSSSPPLSAIRSLQHQDSIYQAFDTYPWNKDKTFLSGLSAILGESNSPTSHGSPQDMATHARIFYYAQRIGVQIDFARYQDWLARNPDHKPPDVIPNNDCPPISSSSSQPEPSVSALPWQQAAPKADLYIERSGPSVRLAGEPSYPLGFAEMLKLLQDGEPVPGIKQIPNTVARDPAVKPVGSRAAPRKPWEKETVTQTPVLDWPQALDDEFPALDAADSGPSAEADHSSSLSSA
ncbi:hypothetical protein XA68_12824 [Ophiocordyceps unilateralis]|uniref:Uncharacterized protein n=1 Tax=Ophiocordyceps unilateralis TaxID=268505 RepID=A0A2A9PCZ8_OPHUN|nr:hypothetical protein XA68_12824 [Ophiocordyceps unilateralis]